MKKYKLFYVGFSMIMNKIEKLIKSLGYDVYLSSNKEICFSSANISLINDEYLSAFIIKINKDLYLSDRYETILSWTKGDEIKTNKPIKLIEKFAKDNDIEFNNYCLTKKFDINQDMDKQIDSFFKVLIYADKIFYKYENK